MSIYDRDWYREEYREKEKKYGGGFPPRSKSKTPRMIFRSDPFSSANQSFCGSRAQRPTQKWDLFARILVAVLVLLMFFVPGGSAGQPVAQKPVDLKFARNNQYYDIGAIGYQIIQLYFTGEQSPEASAAIKDFLAVSSIPYDSFSYDERQSSYFVMLSVYDVTTKQAVEDESQRINSMFHDYCAAKASNFGFTESGVIYNVIHIGF